MPDPAKAPKLAAADQMAAGDSEPPPDPTTFRLTLKLPTMLVIEVGCPAPPNPLHRDGVNRLVDGVVRYIKEIEAAPPALPEYEIHIEPKEGTGFADETRPVLARGKPVLDAEGEPVYHPKWYRWRVPAEDVALAEEAATATWIDERRDELEYEADEEEEGEEEEEGKAS